MSRESAPGKAKSRVMTAGFVAFGFFATWMLWRGVMGALESEEGLVGLVIASAVLAPLVGTALALLVISLRQLKRTATVRAQREGDVVVAAAARMLGNTLGLITAPIGATRYHLGAMFVVVAASTGLELWGGSPRRPQLRFLVPWTNVTNITEGDAWVGRFVPGVVVSYTTVEGKEDEIEFAVCRKGALGAWAELKAAAVRPTVEWLLAYWAAVIGRGSDAGISDPRTCAH